MEGSSNNEEIVPQQDKISPEAISTYNDSKRLSPISPFGPSLSSPDKMPTCKARGVREFEEEVNSLRKENFDLKMRVYVLNEQMELFHNIDNAEQLYEVNASQKRELEKLRAELSDKEDLLLEAGDTMNSLSAKHRDELAAMKMEWEEKCSKLENLNLRLQREYEKLMVEQNLPPNEPSLLDDSAFRSTTVNATNSIDLENLRLEEELAERMKVIEENDKHIKEQADIIQKAKSRQNELEKELKSKSESLSSAYKALREKEHAHLQMCKKAQELEEQLNLGQMELDNLKARLMSAPTPENLREIRNKFECCTTENGILVNKITELENKLEEVESQRAVLANKQVKCLTCRHYKNIEESLGHLRDQLSRKEQELDALKQEQLSAVKAFRGCLKANQALTADIESLKLKLSSCGCSNSKIPQQEELQLKIKGLIEKVAQLQREKETLMANSEENISALQEQLRENGKQFEDRELAITSEAKIRIEELESQVSRLKRELEVFASKEAVHAAEKQQLEADVVVKKKEIDRLNEDLRKKTFNLQEIVNKELWNKNREIEKLNKSNERKQTEIASLKERLVLQEKELDHLKVKMEELSDQVMASESVSDLKAKLAEEIERRVFAENERKQLMETAEESEKTRKELMNACCLFKARLEELATFLESLLPCLGSKKRKILQDAIDRSREASRTLSQSVMHESLVNETTLTAPILPDFSQVDFCSDNDIDVTAEEKKPSVESEKIDNLKSKVDSIVQQLDEVRSAPEKSKTFWKINNYEDKFDFVKLANMSTSFNIEEVSEVSFNESFTDSTSAVLSHQPSKVPSEVAPVDGVKKEPQCAPLSESEGWSEPDRNVSMARIGLRDSSVPVGCESTGESSDNSCKVTVCKRRCEAAEIRRLSLKVRSLERVINSLKTGGTRSPSREISPLAGESADKFEAAACDLKKEKEKLEISLRNNKKILNELALFQEDEPANSKELLKAFHMIADQFEQIYGFFTKMDDHYLIIEEEKETLTQLLLEKERKIESLNKEIASLQVALKEKDNEVLEKQCTLLETKNNYILLEKQCKNMEMTIEEMNQWKSAVEKSGEELEAMKDSYLKEISNLKNKLVKVKEERDAEVNDLKSSLDRAFKRIDDVCLKKVLLETEFKQKVDELQKEKRVEVEQEICKRIEMERKLVDTYDAQVELRKRLDEEMAKNKNIEMAQKSSERWWRRRTEEVESSCADREAELRRRLDNATIATSQAVLERTRLANEKIRLQCELRRRENSAHDMRAELEQRVMELEEANQQLKRKLKSLWSLPPLSDVESPPPFSRQRSHPTSDYTSDPDQLENKGSNSNLNHWFPVCGRSNNNCSPDLGIESDQGRLSSLDPPIISSKSYGDLEREIAHLKRELARKSRLLEESHRASKIVKEKLEDKIYSELGKTHELLEKTKMNFKK